MEIRHIKVQHTFEVKCQCGWRAEWVFRERAAEAAVEHIDYADDAGERPNVEHTVTVSEINRIGRNV